MQKRKFMKFIKLESGKTIEGREIEAFVTEKPAEKYNYIIAGVHGDEIEGMYVLEQLFNWLKDQSFDLPLVIVPVVNLDGKNKNQRTNANGVDLNRNLPSRFWTSEAREAKYFPGNSPLSEPENQFLVSLFKKYPPRFMLSFHSWYAVLNFNSHCKELAEFMSQYNKYPIDGDLEGHPTPGSMGEYLPEHFQAPVLTFECPVLSETVTLEKVWKDTEVALKEIFVQNKIQNFTY